MTLPGLADQMHAFKKDYRICELLHEAFSLLPKPAITYAEAYRKLVKGEAEQVRIADAGGQIVVTGIVPYPPGIPLLAPGEETGEEGGPLLKYLKALEDFDRCFPGFEHRIHGIEKIGGEYVMYCIRGERR
jgi:lysine decarboxylase/arginine decarboxylase